MYVSSNVCYMSTLLPFLYRYFSLLNQPIPDWVLLSLTDPAPLLHPPHAPSLASSSILYYVYGCLFSPGVSHGVTGVVMEMTSNFLNEEGQERKTEAEESGLAILGGIKYSHSKAMQQATWPGMNEAAFWLASLLHFPSHLRFKWLPAGGSLRAPVAALLELGHWWEVWQEGGANN